MITERRIAPPSRKTSRRKYILNEEHLLSFHLATGSLDRMCRRLASRFGHFAQIVWRLFQPLRDALFQRPFKMCFLIYEHMWIVVNLPFFRKETCRKVGSPRC